MRRLALASLLTIGLVGAAVFGVGASSGGGGGTYEVRAIFDDAASAVPGEDVRVAGAKVGSIGKMEVTAQRKAAVELKITDNGFAPFHEDAHCTIRPQSLIGEKFVECTPGTPSQPELKKIPHGKAGAGKYLLTLPHTSSPVDLDLVNDVMRLPYRERFSIILSELGAGFAGRGEDLNALILRADPALRETDTVLKQLAAENVTLRNLASESDRSLAPLARDRQHLAGFIVHANKVGEATAEQHANIERGIQRLPAFLRQLKPTMQDLGSLSDEMTPVLLDLGQASPSLARFIVQLGPFSRSSTRSLVSLGKAADVGGPVLQRARPVVQDLKSFAHTANPVSQQLDELTASLDKTGALEKAMDYIFFQMTAINGYDSIGHYLRAGLIVNVCSTYVTTATPACEAHFRKTQSIQPGSAASHKVATAASAADVRSRAGSMHDIGALVHALLNLGTPSNAQLNRIGRRGIQRIRRQAHQDQSPALANVGNVSARDSALMSYLMGPDS